jgi:sigma-B regulation protein RsbU (phosphoserine phosphatase)
MIVYRADGGRCEVIETEGTWLGVTADIAKQTRDRSLQLGDRDVLVLYTDGVTEAMDKGGKQFGLPRLVDIVERNGTLPVGEMLTTILGAVDAWTDVQRDDVTALVLRHKAAPPPEPQPQPPNPGA